VNRLVYVQFATEVLLSTNEEAKKVMFCGLPFLTEKV